jgi:hypothetical protein
MSSHNSFVDVLEMRQTEEKPLLSFKVKNEEPDQTESFKQISYSHLFNLFLTLIFRL